MERYKALLLGGAGFLGQGLANEMTDRGYECQIIDKDSIDLSDPYSINRIAACISGFDRIFLLASQIGATLFEEDPYPSGAVNRAIYDNVMSAIMAAGVHRLRFFYYSTSEVYWSMPSSNVYIGDESVSAGKIDKTNPRSIYALVKLYAERNLADRMRFFGPGDFTQITIIRPFNVFGPGQKRGVMYSMVKSAVEDGIIRYSDDTTRTLTSLSYISKETLDLVDGEGFRSVNMSRGFSVDMETLASAVGMFLERKFGFRRPSLEKLQPDRSIRYRQASPVIRDPEKIFSILENSVDMHRLTEEIIDKRR